MGTIYLRGRVFWISYQRNGKRIARAAGSTRAEAIQEIERVEGKHIPTRCAAIFSAYLERCQIYVKPGTLTHHRGVLRRLTDHFGSMDARTLSLSDLQAFIAKRRSAGASPATVNLDLRLMRAALNHAVASGILPALPFRIRSLKHIHRLPVAFDPEQVETLLDCADARLRPVILCAVATGLRLQELIYLNVEDVDFSRGEIRVTAKDALGFSPKNHHERAIPLTERLSLALKEHIATLTHRNPTSPLFQMDAETGKRWTTHLSDALVRLMKDCGLYSRRDKTGCHAFRRTFATALLSSGVDVETVRQLGGWGSLGVVQRYVTSSTRIKREAVATLPY